MPLWSDLAGSPNWAAGHGARYLAPPCVALRALSATIAAAMVTLLASGMAARAQPASAPAARLITFAESPGISEVEDINIHCDAIGHRELAEHGSAVLRRTPYLFRGGDLFSLPAYPGYTYLEVTCLSDNGMAFGRVTRAPGGTTPNPLAFGWNPNLKQYVTLAPPARGTGSYAMDASDDGRVVVGYALGSDPPSMRPCVWEERDGPYHATLLSTPRDYNPFLLTAGAAISPDGHTIVASVLSSATAPAKYHTYAWHRTDQGQWERTQLLDQALRVADVANNGVVAGSIQQNDIWRAVRCEPESGYAQLLRIPERHTESFAAGITGAGVVIGYSEGPDAPPRSWRWASADSEPLPIDLPIPIHWIIVTAVNGKGDVGGYYGPDDPAGKFESTVSFILRAENSDAGNVPR